jgi:hypothetical protein
MRRLWLAMAPRPQFTRVMLMNESGKSLLRAHLPFSPENPLAVQRLSEALTLWHGNRVHVVLAVDALADFYTTHLSDWQAALELLTGAALYKLELLDAFQSDADMHRQLKAAIARA